MVRFTLARLLFAACIIALLLLSAAFRRGRRYDILAEQPLRVSSNQSKRYSSNVALGEPCSPFASRGMDDVTIIIKFGAPEVASRLPKYLETLIPCNPDLLLFSDRQDSIDGIEIVDALANLRSKIKDKNHEFEIYSKIQRLDGKIDRTDEGWMLDKYKFLPMMELTASLRPNSDWFVFIELDTYVNWDNLYRFLRRFNSVESHYFGSPVWPKKKAVFAHGGSGYVLSRGALSKMVARGAMFAEDENVPGTHLFGKDVEKECCGDEVLAQVLKDAGVKIEGYWPMFNGERPNSLVFGHEQWCEAMITLHHLEERDFELMRQFESRRQLPKTPLTFRELFDSIQPSLKSEVHDWSNMIDEIAVTKAGKAGLSFAACYNACLEDSKCVQCEHFKDICRLSHRIRLGHEKPRDGYKRYTSGWVEERVEAFRRAQPDCREGAHIVYSNP